MDTIIEFVKVLVGIGKPTGQQDMIMDPTLYHVETTTHTYSGRIQFQDDVFIKLVTEKPRVVKILKTNIKRIKIDAVA